MHNTIQLKGHIDVKTVPDLWRQYRYVMKADSSCEIDLSQANRIDSAGVAFLLALLEKAQQMKATLTLSNMPKQLKELAEIQGVWPLLKGE